MNEWIFSTTCKKRTSISIVIGHTKFVVLVSCFARNVAPVMLRHMTMKLEIKISELVRNEKITHHKQSLLNMFFYQVAAYTLFSPDYYLFGIHVMNCKNTFSTTKVMGVD
jgi:hypothetical protein